MNEKDVYISQEKVDSFKERGYLSDDILPKTKEQRSMNKRNYFTLWMGSVHNIPNYTAVVQAQNMVFHSLCIYVLFLEM